MPTKITQNTTPFFTISGVDIQVVDFSKSSFVQSDQYVCLMSIKNIFSDSYKKLQICHTFNTRTYLPKSNKICIYLTNLCIKL